MVKVRIHFFETGDFMDPDLFIDVEFAVRPMVGDVIHLSNEQDDELEERAAFLFLSGYGDAYEEIEAGSRTRVKEVFLPQGKDYVQIELSV